MHSRPDEGGTRFALFCITFHSILPRGHSPGRRNAVKTFIKNIIITTLCVGAIVHVAKCYEKYLPFGNNNELIDYSPINYCGIQSVNNKHIFLGMCYRLYLLNN